MAEWLKAPVLKTGDVKASVGSNPTLSAKLLLCRAQAMPVFAEQKKAGESDLSAVPILDNDIHQRMAKLTGELIPGAG